MNFKSKDTMLNYYITEEDLRNSEFKTYKVIQMNYDCYNRVKITNKFNYVYKN